MLLPSSWAETRPTEVPDDAMKNAVAGESSLHLYEVVRWGNDSLDADDGGPNGADTCFLVRAERVEEAARLADVELAAAAPERVPPRADVVHLLGDSRSTETEPRILRGPWLENAFNRGWRVWQRERDSDAWIEWIGEAAASDADPVDGG